MPESNWAGTHTYAAERLHRPSSVEEVQEVVAGAQRLRVLGSRHSFTGIADSAELVSLDGLPADVVVDRAAGTVSASAATRYGELAEALNAEGLALHNLASLPHISVGGAIATATHGSGVGNGNLATAVAAIEIVTSSGEIVATRRGDPGFEGFVVGLGALGAVTRVTLEVEPAYEVRQRVFESLGWPALIEHFNAIMSAGYSVSVFTRWGAAVDQVWVKSRVGDAPEEIADELFGAVAATVDRHPILGLDPVNCTPQLGVSGPWSDRLPHFRMGFTPSAGEEIQSEYHVPREHADAAIEALRGRGRHYPPRAAGHRAARYRRRSPVDEPAVRARQRRHPLHLGARPGRRAARARRRRGRACAVHRAPALGQAVSRRGRGDRPALSTAVRLSRPRRAPRPARCVSQRVARAPRAGRRQCRRAGYGCSTRSNRSTYCPR